MVTGRCSCGYAAQSLPVGVGMRDPRGKWLSPCLCRKCRQAVSANVQARTLKCPACKATGIEPYIDPDAGNEEGEEYPSCAASEPLFGIIGDGSDFCDVGSASLARFARHYLLRQSLPALFFLPISIVVSPIRKNRDTFAGRVAGGDIPLRHVATIAFWQQVWPADMACRHAAQRPAAAPAATRP